MNRRLIRVSIGRPELHRAVVVLAAVSVALPGCGALDRASSFLGLSGGPQPGQPGYVAGFLGATAAEEPRAALVARDSLAAGGSAADAAVAAGFALTVTLPSRAGLGGGGACLFFDPRRGTSEAVLFPAATADTVALGGDRPAAVPLMARGLFALHARFGRRPFEEALVPAETLARFGNPVSRALAADLATVGPSLLVDPRARDVFGEAGSAGTNLVQPDLATTLAQIRTAGVGDLHQGNLARRVAEASGPAGGGLSAGALRDAVPRTATPVTLRVGLDTAAFLPPPADGGLAAAVAFGALRGGSDAGTAGASALATAAASRRGAEPAVLLAQPPASGRPGPLPASTALTVLDRDGGAVSCAFTMNNLFGTGRVLPGLGFLLAAAPRPGAVEPPLLAAALVFNANTRAFRYAGAGSGQEAAPMAVAAPMAAHLLRGAPLDAALSTVPEPGRAAAIACTGGLPGDSGSCRAVVDGRGGGLAVLGGS